MNISFRVAREAKAPRKLRARCLPSSAKSKSKSKSSLKFLDATTLRACERDSVGFGCSVDKRSLAATLGSSGSVNVLSGRPSEKERERERDRERQSVTCAR